MEERDMREGREKKRRGERKGKGEPDLTGIPLQHSDAYRLPEHRTLTQSARSPSETESFYAEVRRPQKTKSVCNLNEQVTAWWPRQ